MTRFMLSAALAPGRHLHAFDDRRRLRHRLGRRDSEEQR